MHVDVVRMQRIEDTFAEIPNIMPIGESGNRFSVKLYLFMGYG